MTIPKSSTRRCPYCRSILEAFAHPSAPGDVIRYDSLSLETRLLSRDFRNLSTCTIVCGEL